MTSAPTTRWYLVVLTVLLPLLGPLGCTSSSPQFMGGGQPDAYQPTAGDSLQRAGLAFGVVVGAAALVAGGVVLLLWLQSDDDDERLGPHVPWWED